jgi:hypothetical protein
MSPGRVALVTGGGRGIGRAISLGLAEDGAEVAVNYRRDDAAAKQTVAEIEALGRRARAYRAAVDSLDEDREMVESLLARFGRIDILVNNANRQPGRAFSTRSAEPERDPIHALAPHHLCQLRAQHAPAAQPSSWCRAPPAPRRQLRLQHGRRRGSPLHARGEERPGIRRVMERARSSRDGKAVDEGDCRHDDLRSTRWMLAGRPEDCERGALLVSERARTDEKLNVHGGGQI